MPSYEDVKSTFEFGSSLLDAISKDASDLNDCFNLAVAEADSLEVIKRDQALCRLEEIKRDLHTAKLCKLETLILRLQDAGFSGRKPRSRNK